MLSRITRNLFLKNWAGIVPVQFASKDAKKVNDAKKADASKQAGKDGKKSDKVVKAKPKPKAVERKNIRVTIVGGSGKVGSTLGLLLKQSPWIGTLVLCDTAEMNCGVAMDLSHIDTRCRLQAYTGPDQVGDALTDSHIVLICAGEKRKPGMSMEDVFKSNARIVTEITQKFAACCPKAFLAVVTQPINSLVPLVTEVLRDKGVHDPKRVFGISGVDVIRATTFVSEALSMDPARVIVPVVGGHSEATMVPVLSQTKPCSKLPGQETCDIIRLVKKSADWVYEMKDRDETAILAPAFAAARFTNNILRAMNHHKGVYECAYIHTKDVKGTCYCAMPIELGPKGIKQARLPKMCEYETKVLQDALCVLAADVKKGENYYNKYRDSL